MNRNRRSSFLISSILSCLASTFVAQATSLLPTTTEEQIGRAAAIFKGKVVTVHSFLDPADGHIYSRSVFQVDTVFKGQLPSVVKVLHRGGVASGLGEWDGFAPRFQPGEERLLFLVRRADGSLLALRGGAGALLLPTSGTATSLPGSEFAAGQNLLRELRARTVRGPLPGQDLTYQAAGSELLSPFQKSLTKSSSSATNLLVGSDLIPARFILPDRGDSIPYLIDADYLPAGISQSQAVNAVATALAAWTNVTSIRYTFAGMQSFGQAAPNVTNQDGFLRIQLHDHYNYIVGGGGSGDVLGQGGHGWIIPQGPSTGWTSGGNVIGNDFHLVVRGYLVLQHTNVVMQTLSTFTEVLAHEIGHTIGLDHSSQNPSEPNPLLKQAIMYYLVHADGRGAAVTNWDINVSRQVHPPGNTPPWCYNRFMDIVTSPTIPLNVPGVNKVQLRGYDLQTTNPPFATTDATTLNGAFSVANSNVTYVPNAFYSDSARIDPPTGGYYDLLYARCSDGVNASPFITVNVVSYNADSYNEGIPDSWRTVFFGNPNPGVGSNHHANNDADADGYSNLVEWWLGSAPTNKTSNLRILSITPTNIQWQAKGYEVYEMYGSTNLINWARVRSPIVATNRFPGTNLFNLTNGVGTATYSAIGHPWQFFRIVKVP